ncbi:MAG: hypothetical protein QG582_1112 [Candidatus Thermoplasmatota archaeon]|nr:hypothetical protein [Candidatus Thermoplasmatota archaeon]
MVVATLVFGSFLVVLLSYSEPAASYTSLDPIYIDSATDLSTVELRASHGIIDGDGSLSDPYVICGWIITPGNGGAGITILDRTESFVICRVDVHASSGLLAYAIGLQGVSHAKVNDTLLAYANFGVSSVDSDYVTVESNTVQFCDTAVDLRKVNTYPDYCRVMNNTIGNGGLGIYLSDARCCNASGNSISDLTGYGLRAVTSDYSNFSSNDISGCDESGIFVESSSSCVIYNNTLSENYGWYAGGVYLYDCDGAFVYHNSFVGNTGDVSDQAYDSGGSGNWWNKTTPFGGNYWNDYSGVDVSPADGFGDAPYTVFGDPANTYDYYPLMERPGEETPIPEFGSVVAPVLAVMALFLLVRRRQAG